MNTKPQSVSELSHYLKTNPFVQQVKGPNAHLSKIESAFVQDGILHFRGSASYATFDDVRFDEKGFQVRGFWSNDIRYEYRQ